MHREAGAGGERYKGIETEFADAAAEQIVEARLRHAEASRAPVWVICHPDTASVIAIIRLERSFMFSASAGVSSSASHTLSKNSVVIASSPSVPAAATPPSPYPVSPFAASSFGCVTDVDRTREGGDIDQTEF